MNAIRFCFSLVVVCGLLLGATGCEEITGVNNFIVVQPDAGDGGAVGDGATGDGYSIFGASCPEAVRIESP